MNHQRDNVKEKEVEKTLTTSDITIIIGTQMALIETLLETLSQDERCEAIRAMKVIIGLMTKEKQG